MAGRSPIAKKAFETAVGGLIGAAFGTGAMLLGPRLYDQHISPALAVLLIVFGWYAAVLVHECGHAVAGALGGGRFLYISVGLFKLVRGASGFRLERQRKVAFGGLTAMSPPLDRPIAPYMAWFVAGGPLASLVSSVAAYLIVLASSGHVRTAAATYTLVSSFCFVISIMPLSSTGFFTDGTRLLIAARGGIRAARMNALATMNGLLAAGTRMSEMPQSITGLLGQSMEEGRDGVVAALTLHACALDRGDIAEADQWLAQALAWQQYWPPALRSGMYLEAAYMSARHHHDAAAARTWLSKTGTTPFTDRSSRLVCEAAVLIAEGRHEDARRLLDDAMRLVDQNPLEGMRRMTVDHIADLQRLASDRAAAAAISAD
jgi:hypothetical protein